MGDTAKTGEDKPARRPLPKPQPGQPIRRGDKPRRLPEATEGQRATKADTE